jgi:hypothetical protein
MTEEQELVMNRKPAKNLTDQHILNSLRFETKATDIRAHRIGMRRVLSLYRRGQIARRLARFVTERTCTVTGGTSCAVHAAMPSFVITKLNAAAPPMCGTPIGLGRFFDTTRA